MFRELVKLTEDWESVVFPKVCICCGEVMPVRGKLICPFCLNNRFPETEAGMRPSTSDVILPESVYQQYALWTFDKGGSLQDLLHALKYDGISSVGEEIGALLGKRLMDFYLTDYVWPPDDYVLLPIPLHPLKKRLRGFNQARHISIGIERTTGIKTIPEDAVSRVRNTKSQTGFSVDKRMENIHGAFEIKVAHFISGKVVVIVDYVFTTGATTFELAMNCWEEGAVACLIATIAQA